MKVAIAAQQTKDIFAHAPSVALDPYAACSDSLRAIDEFFP